MENKKKNKYLVTKTVLMLRAVVGAYLLYTAYSLIGAVKASTGKTLLFFVAAIVAFTVIGGLFVIFSIKAIKEGRFVGGALDENAEEEEAPEANHVDEELLKEFKSIEQPEVEIEQTESQETGEKENNEQ